MPGNGLRRDQFRTLEGGINVLVDDGGLMDRHSAVNQCGNYAIGIDRQIFGPKLVEFEKVNVAAGPCDAFFFERHSTADRAD
jgi:hypothetical protein